MGAIQLLNIISGMDIINIKDRMDINHGSVHTETQMRIRHMGPHCEIEYQQPSHILRC